MQDVDELLSTLLAKHPVPVMHLDKPLSEIVINKFIFKFSVQLYSMQIFSIFQENPKNFEFRKLKIMHFNLHFHENFLQ